MPRPTARELKATPLFGSIKPADLELLSSSLQVLEVAPGTVVIEEGAANDSFFVVRDGMLDVFVGADRRTTLGPGTFFGEISLEHQTRTR